MPFDVQPTPVTTETQVKRRVHRDQPTPARIDKVRVLAHLRAQLAELETSKETMNGNA